MIAEFKKFILRGNVLDMAIGIIIGTAFGAIVKSLVADILMPPIGLLLGDIDFSNLLLVLKEGTQPAPYLSLAEAQNAGAVTINYGLFLNAVISFLIMALAVFFLVRAVNRLLEQLKKEEEEAPAAAEVKDCPFCFSSISIRATRCPHCTSELP